MKRENHFVRLVLKTAGLGVILAAGAVAFGQGDFATCPYDGEQAQRISVEQVHSDSCRGDVYNAERDTYSHIHVNGALLERHTFSTTTCFQY